MAVYLLQHYSYIHTSWGSGSWSSLSVQESKVPHHRATNCSQLVPFKMQFAKAEVLWKYWKKRKGSGFIPFHWKTLFPDSGESPKHCKIYCQFINYWGSKTWIVTDDYVWKLITLLLTFMSCHKNRREWFVEMRFSCFHNSRNSLSQASK